jgi:hypothetical protein
MGRTKGSKNKKQGGISIIVGMQMEKPKKKKNAVKTSSTQGKKPMSKLPNSMRSKMPK